MAQVGNKNIDNASGQVVRTDIENTFEAVATNNFGARNNAGTILPCEFLADDTTNKLLIRGSSGGDQANPSSSSAATFFEVGNLDEANLGLLPKAGGTMTGQILGDDSSVAGSPAYAFDNDSDTGMFRSGANTIGFSTSGTERVSISDAGLDVVNGLPIRLQDSSGSPFVSLKSPSALSGNIALTLPSSITNGGFLQTDGSGNLSFQIVAGVPSGSVFCMAVATVPSGYLECNGAAVSRTTYAALFAIIGTTYGTGNGSSTFNLPDLRGEFVRGFDHGRGVDSGRSINNPQGASNASHNHSISLSGTTSTKSLTGSVARIAETMAAHGTASGVFTKRSNVQTPTTPNATDSSPAGGFDMDASHNHTFSASGTSGSQGSEARPRNIAMMYIIKV
jgi:microcystin-dependent protein